MDSNTREMLEALKLYLDEVQISHQGWENTSRIFLMAYGKLMEISAHLSPSMGADKITKAHFEIATALRDLSEIIRETEDQD